VRQYALEKLGESGEGDAERSLHRDYHTAMAALGIQGGPPTLS
jgi:predicted ATPase